MTRRKHTTEPEPEPEPDYKKQVETLKQAVQGTMTLAIAYLSSGAMISAAISAPPTETSLRATKAALQQVLAQVDENLLQVVKKAAEPPTPAGTTEGVTDT